MFIDDENIPLVTQQDKDCDTNHDNDSDDCNIYNTYLYQQTTNIIFMAKTKR